MTWLVHLGVVAVFIGVSALYVAAEFSAVAVRRSRVRPMAERGHRLARILLPVLESVEELDRYIAASQVGITLSSLVLGAYAQATIGAMLAPQVQHYGGFDELTALSITSLGVLVALTVVQVLVGELIPKSLALQYPTQVALVTVLPMWWTGRVLGWFIAALNGTSSAILRAIGLGAASQPHIHSPEEIELLFAESRKGGLLDPAEHRRLERALRLSTRRAADLMVPRRRLSAIESHTPAAKALDYLVASPFTRLPVYEGTIDNIVGLLHTKDVVQRNLTGPSSGTVGDIVRPLTSISASATGDQLLKLMRDRRCHQAIVRAEDGTVAGFVTLEDVLVELVGRVGDEFKE